MSFQFLRRKTILAALLAVAFAGGTFFWPFVREANADSKRYPYEHVIRITATLEFDEERIDVDDLVDCRSNYEGPAAQAAKKRFISSRVSFPYKTRSGGMLVYNIQANICGAFADIWAGAEESQIPNKWLPIIRWFDQRDAHLVRRGAFYLSETAIKNPNGRLKVVEGFRLSYPEQTVELVAEAAKQITERDLWQGSPPGKGNARLGLKRLPWYLKIPRQSWSQPPSFRRAPDRPSDPEGLRELLDSIPKGDDLIFISEMIQGNDALSFSINDLMAGHWGGHYFAHASAGIPQRNELLWGMRINQATWEKAQKDIEDIVFFDDWVPLDLKDGVMTLRTDTPGMAYMVKEYGDWYRATDRPFKFLGRTIGDGAYDNRRSLYIFDTKTRDLWVRSG